MASEGPSFSTLAGCWEGLSWWKGSRMQSSMKGAALKQSPDTSKPQFCLPLSSRNRWGWSSFHFKFPMRTVFFFFTIYLNFLTIQDDHTHSLEWDPGWERERVRDDRDWFIVREFWMNECSHYVKQKTTKPHFNCVLSFILSLKYTKFMSLASHDH